MNIPDIIIKKKNGGELSRDDINFFVDGVVKSRVQESQIGAMLMAMCLKGLSETETTNLTREMINSGDTFDWPEEWKGIKVDKHSTGGVGDKVSLVLAPALAACGMKVPMISGRGLEHTGGTLDKLESIPGFEVSIPSEEMKQVVKEVGCYIVGQNESVCPADGTLYAIRDVTGTVDNFGLITASIISKKAAERIDALVLDVKFGDGSLIPEKDRARELATDMVRTGCDLGMKTIALLTSMESPLGYMVGNALEVAESVTCLHGKGPDDLTSLVVTLGGHLLYSVGKSASLETGAEEIRKSIQDGRALKTFCSMLKGQRVDSNIAEGLCRAGADVMDILKRADNTKDLLSPSAGYVSGISAKTCAVVTKKLGGGRFKAGGTIDHAVGLQLLVTVGDWIEAGSPWVRVHYNGEFSASLQSTLQQSLTLTLEKINVNGSKNRVAEVITNSKQDPIDDNGQIV